MEAGGAMVAASRVDGKYGVHLGSILSPPVLASGGMAAPTVSRLFLAQQDARRTILNTKVSLGVDGTVVTRPETLVPYPTLVWEPCLESLSPYYPFRMFIAGVHRLYVRVDGKVFTKLTTDIRGA
jgi:hypothetical protein